MSDGDYMVLKNRQEMGTFRTWGDALNWIREHVYGGDQLPPFPREPAHRLMKLTGPEAGTSVPAAPYLSFDLIGEARYEIVGPPPQ